MLQGSESPATLSVSLSFHLFLLFPSPPPFTSLLKQKVFCARRAAEAVQADRHNTRMQTIYRNPGVLFLVTVFGLLLQLFLKKKYSKKSFLNRHSLKFLQENMASCCLVTAFFFFPFPAPCGHSWLQNWIQGDTSEVGFFEFSADCVTEKRPLGVGILGRKVGRTLNFMAIGLCGFRKTKDVKVSWVHARSEQNTG